LLELVLQNEKIKAPVGRVEYLFLGPMTFGEFLLACGRTVFYEQLSTFNIEQINNPITLGQHKELLELLKQYFFVGGMPEVVKLFVESNFNYLEARKVQEQIIESYKEDISKYTDGKIRTVIQEVFDKFPKFIGQKNKYQNYSEEKSIYVSESLNVLEAIFWIQKVYHSNASGLPLKQGENLKIFKSYHLDIGLYNCQMNLKWNDFAFLGENEILTKGMIAEQFIAQHLFNSNAKTTKYHLNYWLKDQSTQKAEVDFMLAEKKLYPIEVKAGKIGKIKSLISFIQSKDNLNLCPIRFDAEYRSHFQEHIDYRSGDKIINFQLTSYPLYLVEFWNK
jgi:predicted AAA+ superfamily ATPase